MQKNEEVGWGEWVARGIGIGCVVTVLLAFFPGWHLVGRLFAEKDAPAWVQAVGSIAAIFAAIGIAAWQRREEMRRLHRQEIERERAAAQRRVETRLSCERFIGTASASIEQLQYVLKTTPQKLTVQLIGAGVSEALEMARSVDLSPLGITDATTAIAARSICSQIVVLIESEVKSQSSPPMPNLRGLIHQYVERIHEIESAWEQGRLPSPPSPVL